MVEKKTKKRKEIFLSRLVIRVKDVQMHNLEHQIRQKKGKKKKKKKNPSFITVSELQHKVQHHLQSGLIVS